MRPFDCPACGGTNLSPAAPGTAIHCPQCGVRVTIPKTDRPSPNSPGDDPPTLAYADGISRPPSRSLAATSRNFGILGITVGFVVPIVLALTGMTTGIIALVRIKRYPQKYEGHRLAIAGIITSAIGLTVVPAIQLWTLARLRELSVRTVCAAHLRSLGSAMYIYADDESAVAFPDDLSKLLTLRYTTPKQFNCPSAPPGRQCYYYIAGASTDSQPTRVIMFEHPDNHWGDGGHVLYQDGHVVFVKFPEYQQIIDDHADIAQ